MNGVEYPLKFSAVMSMKGGLRKDVSAKPISRLKLSTSSGHSKAGQPKLKPIPKTVPLKTDRSNVVEVNPSGQLKTKQLRSKKVAQSKNFYISKRLSFCSIRT
jgi:hypothetical protein